MRPSPKGPPWPDYGSIQAALDANPRKVVHVPPGEYLIHDKIRIQQDGSGLAGHGKIIQTNARVPIIEIDSRADVQLRDLTLTRAETRRKLSAKLCWRSHPKLGGAEFADPQQPHAVRGHRT